MHADDFVLDHCTNWQAIETLCKNLPKLDRMSSFTLIIKAIHAIDRSRLMISSKKEEIFWIFNLVSQEQAYCFQVMGTSVNIIT